jgi:hypothetical protein
MNYQLYNAAVGEWDHDDFADCIKQHPNLSCINDDDKLLGIFHGRIGAHAFWTKFDLIVGIPTPPAANAGYLPVTYHNGEIVMG